MNPLYLIIFFFILILVLGFLTKRTETKRRIALQEKAQQLGFAFTEKATLELILANEQFQLFSLGHSKRVNNLMQRKRPDGDEIIFDFRYTTGSGKSSHTYNQTVVLFQSPRLNLPKFELKPEHLFHKIGQAFGYQDIDFQEHPDFSKNYLLRGEDEEMIRKLFTHDVVSFFREKNKICIEGLRNAMIIYKTGKRLKPEEIFIYFEKARGIFDTFRRRSEYL